MSHLAGFSIAAYILCLYNYWHYATKEISFLITLVFLLLDHQAVKTAICYENISMLPVHSSVKKEIVQYTQHLLSNFFFGFHATVTLNEVLLATKN